MTLFSKRKKPKQKTPEDFNEVAVEAQKLYRTIKKVKCPYFNECVLFNTKGLEHIIYKRARHKRSSIDQYKRYKLLHLAPKIIRKSNVLQGIDHHKVLEPIKENKKWKQIMVDATYYIFVAIIDDLRVKVTVKQISGSNEKYFWSIQPFWERGENWDNRIMNYGGNPEED